MPLIAKCFEALLIDNVTKESFATATLEEAGFEITSETTDVEGGGGLVAVLHSPRKENITIKDVRFHFEILAKQLGTEIVVGAGEAYSFPTELTIKKQTTKNIITLPYAPKTPSNVKLYKSALKTVVDSDDYTITGTTIEFSGVGYNEGDKIKVDSYIFATSETSSTIEINNSKYPHGVTCVLKTLEIDENELPLNMVQIILDNCVFDGSIKIDTKSKPDAARHDMNLKCLNKIGNDIAGRIVRIPV